ncbi:MAG: DUF885 family protein [Desulfurococcaceae archaeon]
MQEENLKSIDREMADFYRKLRKELFIPSAEYINSLKSIIQGLRIKTTQAKVKHCNRKEKSCLLIDHVLELLDSIEITIEENLRHPSKFIRGLGYRIYSIVFDERKSIDDKLVEISNIVDKMAEFYGALLEITRKARDERIKRAIVTAEGLVKDIENMTENLLNESRKAGHVDKGKYFNIIQKLCIIGSYVSSYVREANAIIGKERDVLEDIPYEIYVEKKYRLPLKWIVKWHEKELRSSIDRFKEMACAIDPTRDPIEVLKSTIHVSYSTPEEMFNDMKKFLEIARDHASKYIDLPQDIVCEVTGVREFEKDIYPMGYAGVPDPLEKETKCMIALNQYNYRAFSRGWLMMMAIHEAYYGHNIHWIKVGLADIPESFKIPSDIGSPLAEGLAHRGEELLQDIYGDKSFPLLVAWRRVHTALRVYIEINMFLYNKITPEDAVKLYMNIMGFDEQTAKGLVEAHLENRGYNLCYLAGYKMIEEYRSKLRDLDEKTFSNTLFSAGFISIRNVKKVLDIKEDMPWEKD